MVSGVGDAGRPKGGGGGDEGEEMEVGMEGEGTDAAVHGLEKVGEVGDSGDRREDANVSVRESDEGEEKVDMRRIRIVWTVLRSQTR